MLLEKYLNFHILHANANNMRSWSTVLWYMYVFTLGFNNIFNNSILILLMISIMIFWIILLVMTQNPRYVPGGEIQLINNNSIKIWSVSTAACSLLINLTQFHSRQSQAAQSLANHPLIFCTPLPVIYTTHQNIKLS